MSMEVIRLRRTIAIVAAAVLLALSGCGGTEDGQASSDEVGPSADSSQAQSSEPEMTSGPANPCASDGKLCSNQEVNTNGCDAGPKALGEPKQLGIGRVTGVLELRQAASEVCPGIVWARFRPYGGTSAEWVVTIETEGVPMEDQRSDESDPAIDGYTEGVFVRKGEGVTGCLVVGNNPPECVTATLPPA